MKPSDFVSFMYIQCTVAVPHYFLGLLLFFHEIHYILINSAKFGIDMILPFTFVFIFLYIVHYCPCTAVLKPPFFVFNGEKNFSVVTFLYLEVVLHFYYFMHTEKIVFVSLAPCCDFICVYF